ncbi:MAG: DUF6285 domain-containing protein [Betaproteobacteria bacterium]
MNQPENYSRTCSARYRRFRSRFNALSSAYVLAICERELQRGEIADTAERERWSRLIGYETDLSGLRAHLCRSIRAGLLDERWEEVLQALIDTAIDEVRIVKPDHLALEHRTKD